MNGKSAGVQPRRDFPGLGVTFCGEIPPDADTSHLVKAAARRRKRLTGSDGGHTWVMVAPHEEAPAN